MGKTNSGGKLTQAQYQIILGHSAGSTDKLDQEIAKIRNGGPSKKQRANILQAAKDAQSELYQQGHDAWEQFHGAVESDPRYKNNPHARIVLNQMERNTFSGLHGYGQSAAPAGATPQQESALKNGFKVIK
jgi:hypothetical protein